MDDLQLFDCFCLPFGPNGRFDLWRVVPIREKQEHLTIVQKSTAYKRAMAKARAAHLAKLDALADRAARGLDLFGPEK